MDETSNQPQTTPVASTSASATAHPPTWYRILYYILAVIEALLATRFLLLLFGANIEAGFAQIIKTLTDPFMTPFVGLFPTKASEAGASIFSPSTLVAMLVYAIVFYGIAQLIRILTSKKS